MSKGECVKVRLYGGKTTIRRVVAAKRDVVVICADEEYVLAEREHREPEGMGLPRADIIEVAPERNGAASEYGPIRQGRMSGD